MGNNEVVIATTDISQALHIIAKEAMIADEIEICFTEKFAPTVEYLLRILRKGFGWLETDRGEKQTTNTKCFFNQRGECTLKKNLEERGVRFLKCTEVVRTSCNHYKPKYKDPMTINYITIEKAGGIRGL